MKTAIANIFTYLILIASLMLTASSPGENDLRSNPDNLAELKKRCLKKDYEACLEVHNELKKVCADPAIANDFQKNLNCMRSAQCWENLGIASKQIGELKILYGEGSQSYKKALERFEQILAHTDTCKTLTNQF